MNKSISATLQLKDILGLKFLVLWFNKKGEKGGGAGRQVLVAIKTGRRPLLNHPRGYRPRGGAENKTLPAIYGSYYSPASGFIVVKYATLRAFKVINYNLSIAFFRSRQLTVSVTSFETFAPLLTHR